MTLKYLPLEDSQQHADLCESLLFVSRDWLRGISKETQQIMSAMQYSCTEKQVVLGSVAEKCSKVSIAPDMPLPKFETPKCFETSVQVINETTLMTARRLTSEGRRPLVLNFANGTHVGGGFLSGARAQEETLCYASTLYSTLVHDPMYAYNNLYAPMESTNYMILSQAIVFRDDRYSLIEEPWVMDVLTATAPIAQSRWGGISQKEGAHLMVGRIARLFDVAMAYGYTDLILGAWGCGAFGNDPVLIAGVFEQELQKRSGYFEKVIFTIADWSAERRFLGPFAAVFSPKEE